MEECQWQPQGRVTVLILASSVISMSPSADYLVTSMDVHILPRFPELTSDASFLPGFYMRDCRVNPNWSNDKNPESDIGVNAERSEK